MLNVQCKRRKTRVHTDAVCLSTALGIPLAPTLDTSNGEHTRPLRACKPATVDRVSLGPRWGPPQAGEAAEVEEVVGEEEDRGERVEEEEEEEEGTEEATGEHQHRHHPPGQRQVPRSKNKRLEVSGISLLANHERFGSCGRQR